MLQWEEILCQAVWYPRDLAEFIQLMLWSAYTDAMFVYMDQAENYRNAGCIASQPDKKSSSLEWDCAKWSGFGKRFAFIHTGRFGHSINGTTLAVSKKGSDLNDIINPCMDRFLQTEEYYQVWTR